MSSAVFAANNKFVSVLTGKSYPAGTPSFYLTCAGNVAIPEKQIEASKKETGFDTGYRIVVVGHEWKKGRFGRSFKKAVFGWEQKVGREWKRVVTWSNMVPVEEAKELGFKVPGRTTNAMKGKRTVGVEHEVESDAIENDDEETITVEGRVVTPETTTALAPVAPRVPEGTTIEDVARAFAAWNVD